MLDDPNREIRIPIRFNPAEVAVIDALAKARGLTFSAAIRYLVHSAVKSPAN